LTEELEGIKEDFRSALNLMEQLANLPSEDPTQAPRNVFGSQKVNKDDRKAEWLDALTKVKK
jgi:hypothetical protein